jgi:hypothetical protein
MTAKEQLRERVDELTEAEAADTLDYLARRVEFAHRASTLTPGASFADAQN